MIEEAISLNARVRVEPLRERGDSVHNVVVADVALALGAAQEVRAVGVNGLAAPRAFEDTIIKHISHVPQDGHPELVGLYNWPIVGVQHVQPVMVDRWVGKIFQTLPRVMMAGRGVGDE